MIYHNGVLSMVLKRTSSPTQEFVCLPFKNVVFLNNNRKVCTEDHQYEIIQIDETKDYKPCTPEELLEVSLTIYKHNDLILPLEKYPMTPWEHYVELLGWTDLAKHYPTEDINDICHKVSVRLNAFFTDVKKCNIGWVHGDLHVPNVLKYEDKFYIIDFDTSRLSYSAINVAQAYYIENMKKHMLGVDGWSFDKVQRQYQHIIANLSEADAVNFGVFVRLMGFYWEARTIPFRMKNPVVRIKELRKLTFRIFRLVKSLAS